MTKKLARLVVMLLTVFLIGFVWQSDRSDSVVARADTIPGKGTPSAAPINLIFFNLTTGYSLQPQDQYTYVNNPKTLTTGIGLSIVDSLILTSSKHYQWYQSTDAGKTWTKMSKQTSSSLTVTPTEVGTVYYQQSMQYYTLTSTILTPTYYSRVAAVTTLPDPVNATKLDVTADSNYLYNNQKSAETTYVHATPTPSNSTGDVTWTSDDTSLATVDSNGEVTANTNSKSGTVNITGTMTNADGSKVTDSVAIKIGGGLDDQTVDQGKTATFDVQGNFDQKPSAVVWHKVTASGKDSVVSSGTSLSYTTPETTADDDQSKYYAVLTISMDGASDQTITTNKATLTVNIDQTPQVSVTSKIVDVTDNSGNTDTELTNVIAGDSAEITGTITDSNANSKLDNGDFMIKMPGDASNTAIYIDGKKASYYPQTIDGDVYMVVSGIDFSSTKTHTYEVDFQSNTATDSTFTTNATIQGYDASNNELDSYEGPTLTIKTSDNTISATAGDVSFGELTFDDVGKQISGQVTGGGNLLDVTDNRRDKAATSVSLRQDGPFTDGTHDLEATLSYNDGSGKLLPLTSTDQVVYSASTNDKVPSLGTDNGQELSLKLATQAIYEGNYSTTLEWTIANTPE